jgi:hypothetical protein
MPDNRKDAKHGEHQTDLAEGEQKHDQQGKPAPKT